MQLTFVVGAAELDVDVVVHDADADVARLAEALADGAVAAGTGLRVDGRLVAPTTPVVDAGLRQGASIELARDAAPVSAEHCGTHETPAPVELRVVGGVDAGRRFPLSPGSHVVGRDPAADVVLDHPTVSTRHARVDVARPDFPRLDHNSCGQVAKSAVVTVVDLGSRNGTRVGGAWATAPHRASDDTVVDLGALQCVITATDDVDRARVGPPDGTGTAAFNRPPRPMATMVSRPITAPVAPASLAAGARFGWAALLAPLVMGAALAVVFNPLMAVFCLFSPVMLFGNWLEERRRARRARRDRDGLLTRDLDAFGAALSDAVVFEVARRRRECPDPAEAVRRAVTPTTSLWERRPGHADFGRLRVGAGDVPWSPPVARSDGPGGPGTVDAMAAVDRAIAEASTLPGAPVVVELSGGHTVGVVGPRRPGLALARSLVVQMAVHHGPADLRVAVVADVDRVDAWDWAKWLPHTRGRDGRRWLAATGRDGDALLAALAAPTTNAPTTNVPTTLLVLDAHVVGMVTDLDEALGRRALRCLEAELRHRERRLRDVGARDLSEWAGRVRDGDDPLPRLVVVIDELATLVAELPDFVDSLVDVAQRGRSLGVHLVLATQRPSGALSDAIRANTNVRIALRVQDVVDSTDVLGTPAAASISRRHPGRALMRLGPSEVVAMQTALATTTAAGALRSPVIVRPFAIAKDGPRPRLAERSAAPGSAPSDLARLVDAAVEAHGRTGGRPPRRPWPPPLPERLLLDDLAVDDLALDDLAPDHRADAADLAAGVDGAPVALIDEPADQRQRVVSWSPADGHRILYGVNGSGTTTALATFVVSLARARPPDEVHVYILDFGSQALAPLARLPHVGAVIGASERERHQRLLRHLLAEIDRRRRLVARAGPAALRALPAVIVVVDNFGAFVAAFDDLAGAEWTDAMARVVADGAALGITMVATADRAAAVPHAVAALVAHKTVFRLADPFDYATFGISGRSGPGRIRPGRAVDAASGCELQFALPGRGALADAVAALMGAPAWRAHAAAVEHARPRAIGVMPDAVAIDDIAGGASYDGETWLVPIAIGDRELAPVGFALGPGEHAVVAGPHRAGKSTVAHALVDVARRSRPEVDVRLITPADDVATVADECDRPRLVVVDDADLIDDADGCLAQLVAAGHPDQHVVITGRPDGLRARYGHFTTAARRSRQALLLRPDVDVDGDLVSTPLPRRGATRFLPGRGYLVRHGECELVQAAR